MTLLLNSISFILFFYIFAYLPGFIILKKLKIKSFWDLNLAVGITILGSLLFFGRWLLSSNQILFIIFLANIYFSFLEKIPFNIKTRQLRINYQLLLVLLLGVIAQAFPYILSLSRGEPAISFDLISSHDQAWHASLIYELVNHFPPQIPGFSGVILKNYHYLYDLILAANLKVFHLSLPYLLQGIYPIGISLFFGISIFRITTLLAKDKLTPILAVFFGYFVNNLSFFQQFWGKTDWQISDLIIDQPIIYLFNHQTVLSISLVIYLLILISKISSEKIEVAKTVLISVGLSSLILLKIYAFIVIIFTLGFYWLLHFRKKNLLLILFFTSLISFAYILLTFNLGGKFINFNPGWIGEAFLNKTLFPLFPKLYGLQMIWQQQGSHFRLDFLKIFSSILLILLSFHLRLLGFLLFFKKPKNLTLLMLLTCFFSLLFSLVGNQAITAYNIIQFLPYTIILTTILSLLIISKLNYFLKYLFIIFYLFLSLSSLKPINSYFHHQSNIKDLNKISLLQLLSNYSQGTIISFKEENSENNLLSAVSGHRSFYTDQQQLIVLGLDYQERLKIIDQLNSHFCEFTDQDKQIINNNYLKYFLTANNQLCNDPSLTIIKSLNNLNLYEYQE